RGIGRDAGVAVGAAALERQHELAGRGGLALAGVRDLAELAHVPQALLDGRAGAARGLDLELAHGGAQVEPGRLHDLAAQAYDEHAAEVRVSDVAVERA